MAWEGVAWKGVTSVYFPKKHYLFSDKTSQGCYVVCHGHSLRDKDKDTCNSKFYVARWWSRVT